MFPRHHVTLLSRLALLLASTSFAAACDAMEPASDSQATPGGKADTAGCPEAAEAIAVFEEWVANQPPPNYPGKKHAYWLEYIVETGPDPVLAVRVRTTVMSSMEVESLLLYFDAGGHERHRVYGRYINRLGPENYLVNVGLWDVHWWKQSYNPYYEQTHHLAAFDRDGMQRWDLSNIGGNIDGTRLYRLPGDRYVIIAADTQFGQWWEGFAFDADGKLSKPEVVASVYDDRECASTDRVICTGTGTCEYYEWGPLYW